MRTSTVVLAVAAAASALAPVSAQLETRSWSSRPNKISEPYRFSNRVTRSPLNDHFRIGVVVPNEAREYTHEPLGNHYFHADSQVHHAREPAYHFRIGTEVPSSTSKLSTSLKAHPVAREPVTFDNLRFHPVYDRRDPEAIREFHPFIGTTVLNAREVEEPYRIGIPLVYTARDDGEQGSSYGQYDDDESYPSYSESAWPSFQSAPSAPSSYGQIGAPAQQYPQQYSQPSAASSGIAQPSSSTASGIASGEEEPESNSQAESQPSLPPFRIGTTVLNQRDVAPSAAPTTLTVTPQFLEKLRQGVKMARSEPRVGMKFLPDRD